MRWRFACRWGGDVATRSVRSEQTYVWAPSHLCLESSLIQRYRPASGSCRASSDHWEFRLSTWSGSLQPLLWRDWNTNIAGPANPVVPVLWSITQWILVSFSERHGPLGVQSGQQLRPLHQTPALANSPCD
ncbi:hypothetical protein J5N97_010235 [Dioscorea zingiberensis]|uniref:Uncharacterized protein n=1 Tax=Dioscorea zingiberensis TaxID=325984 RepID=A0A9D5CY18_9LILI|nr:hypothetical protein J5N97_010235 [Dioscorea zingiberensis]